MKRRGCAGLAVAALAAVAVAALALSAYREQDDRARFARVAGELVAVRDSTSTGLAPDGWRLTEVTLVGDTGLEARARVRSPGLYDGVRRPAAIVVSAFGEGRRIVDAPAGTGGVVLAGLEVPYERDLPRGLGWLWGWVGLRSAILRTPPELLLVAQYLYTREDVDPRRVTIVGAGPGAPLALAAAATDRRLAGVALVGGGGEIGRTFAGAVADSLPAWAIEPAARVASLLLAPVEPAKYAGAIAPRPILVVSALDDERAPRADVLELHAAARRPKRLVWLDVDPATGSRVAPAALDEVLRWMSANGLR